MRIQHYIQLSHTQQCSNFCLYTSAFPCAFTESPERREHTSLPLHGTAGSSDWVQTRTRDNRNYTERVGRKKEETRRVGRSKILKSTRCTRRERRGETPLSHELMWAGCKSSRLSWVSVSFRLMSSGHLCFCSLELPWDRQTNSYEFTENNWWTPLSWVCSTTWRVKMAKTVHHLQRLQPSSPQKLELQSLAFTTATVLMSCIISLQTLS